TMANRIGTDSLFSSRARRLFRLAASPGMRALLVGPTGSGAAAAQATGGRPACSLWADDGCTTPGTRRLGDQLEPATPRVDPNAASDDFQCLVQAGDPRPALRSDWHVRAVH